MSKKGGFMAGQIPYGNHEPAFVEMYKGCTIYSYLDSEDALRLVMIDRDGRVKHGTREAVRLLSKANLANRYELQLVREIK
jgi:hypothetical protein